jgi:hypothetical protein
LREIYEKKLAAGPFPTADCSTARLTGREHGRLTMFVADIAGIASHGRRLDSITETRKWEFKKIVARSFEERWPATNAKITSERAPTLFHLMKDTEEARVLIVRCLE